MSDMPSIQPRSRAARMARDRAFSILCWLVAGVSIVVLGVLLVSILTSGIEHLDADFISDPPSRKPENAGLGPAMWGSIWICAVCAIVAIPLGVGTAVFLEEYKPTSSLVKRLHGFVQLNIANLAGVPSIVYGIIGLTAFVQMFGVVGNLNEPAYTIGQKWFDSYALVDGTLAYVRVDDRHADAQPASESLRYTDQDGRLLEVNLVDEASVAPLVDEIDEQVDAFREDMDERLEDVEELTDDSVGLAFDQAFRDSNLKLDPADLRPELVAGIADLNELSGRELRRGMRAVMSRVFTAEIQAQLPDTLILDTDPTRVDKKAFYYIQLPFGRGVLAGGLTLMLVILPVIIISSQEALRSVPNSLRESALGLGATKWQMVSRMTLPAAVPGIMTGSILAMSRAIGEAAPILIIAGIVFIRFTPGHLMDEFTAMPLQIYDWAGRPQESFHHVAASGIIVLLAVLLTFNGVAVFIRQKFQKPLQ